MAGWCSGRSVPGTVRLPGLMMLPTTLDSVTVIACCAPITSVFSLDTSAPVCAQRG